MLVRECQKWEPEAICLTSVKSSLFRIYSFEDLAVTVGVVVTTVAAAAAF